MLLSYVQQRLDTKISDNYARHLKLRVTLNICFSVPRADPEAILSLKSFFETDILRLQIGSDEYSDQNQALIFIFQHTKFFWRLFQKLIADLSSEKYLVTLLLANQLCPRGKTVFVELYFLIRSYKIVFEYFVIRSSDKNVLTENLVGRF